MLGESLLERAEHLAIHREHPDLCDKNCYDMPAPHHHHHHLPKLRRERSCHDIPLVKEVEVREVFSCFAVLRFWSLEKKIVLRVQILIEKKKCLQIASRINRRILIRKKLQIA
jgi:hypothetical protein